MHSAVPRFGADGHRGGGEILHLFQSEIQLFGFGSQFGHVFGCASRVGRDEVGDDLLLQPTFAVDTVEDAFEVVELLERGLSHQVQHAVGSVLRCYFQAAGDVPCDEFASIEFGSAVDVLVLRAMQQQVITHTATDEALLDARQCINGSINVEQRSVVGVQIFANGRMNARGTFAALAQAFVASLHAIHIGRRAAEVAEITFEVGHVGDLLHFAQDALF